jgi:hypothetical protein
VAEAEYGLDGGIFGNLAAGGNARLFLPLDEKHMVDMQLVTKLWRKERIRRTRLPGPRPERRRHPTRDRRRPVAARRR